jgi:hypothetical protein
LIENLGDEDAKSKAFQPIPRREKSLAVSTVSALTMAADSQSATTMAAYAIRRFTASLLKL